MEGPQTLEMCSTREWYTYRGQRLAYWAELPPSYRKFHSSEAMLENHPQVVTSNAASSTELLIRNWAAEAIPHLPIYLCMHC
jgi:hypothetical protein